MPKPKERYKAIKEKLKEEAMSKAVLEYKIFDIIKLDKDNYAVVQLEHDGAQARVSILKDGLSATRAYVERDNLGTQENIRRIKKGL